MNTLTSAASSAWCVPISHDEAIARVKRLSAEVESTDRFAAKLVSRAERDAATPQAHENRSAGDVYWAIGVDGSVRPSFSESGTYVWGVFDVDARTGMIVDTSAGPATTHSYFGSLPDHARDCAA